MTVSTQLNYVSYPGDNVATNFAFSFPVFDSADLYVYYQDNVTKLLTLLILGVDYSVTGVGSPTGGAVVTTVPVPNTVRILITRVVPLTQDLDVLNEGGFYPANFEKALDTQEMAIQQIAERVLRSVRGQFGEAFDDLPPAPDRAGKLLGFTNDALAGPTIDTESLLVALLSAILTPGVGISITPGSNIITITNTAPFVPQDCWLLESGTSGGGGGSGDAEFVRDTIGAALQAIGAVVTVNDIGDTITVDLSQAATAEIIRDVMGVALTAGTGITITPNDPGDTITIAADLSGVGEIARDALGAALVGGVGITITPNDSGDTITVDNIPDILSIVSNATITPTFAYDQVNVTALAVNTTIADWTGTAIDGHGIVIRIKDNGVSRTIGYGTKYRVFNDALPTATTVGKTLYIFGLYNLADDKIDILGVRLEA